MGTVSPAQSTNIFTYRHMVLAQNDVRAYAGAGCRVVAARVVVRRHQRLVADRRYGGASLEEMLPAW